MRQTDSMGRRIYRFGREILESDTVNIEKGCRHHGRYSVYEHSMRVTKPCIKITNRYHIPVNMGCLIRGALLHDYFLYDWHEFDKSHQFHAFSHAKCALHNAERDFKLTAIEKNMILTHMFPMNLTVPRYRESVILCIADKICAIQETTDGIILKCRRKYEVLKR